MKTNAGAPEEKYPSMGCILRGSEELKIIVTPRYSSLPPGKEVIVRKLEEHDW